MRVAYQKQGCFYAKIPQTTCVVLYKAIGRPILRPKRNQQHSLTFGESIP